MADDRVAIRESGEGTRVLVAGVTGYAGALAADIVDRHPDLVLAQITGRSHVGERLDSLYPRYGVEMEIAELEPGRLEDVEAAIVAYPHGAAAPTVAELRGMGISVVDLSADFRLEDLPTYERFYGEHGSPELLDGAVYGLPEIGRDQIRMAELISNPGCYPTATILGLAPLIRTGLVEDVVVDAKSGTSGAGREGGEPLSFVNVTENVRAYTPRGHRHRPEILEKLAGLAPGGQAPSLAFVPHLVPVDQGELVTIYARTAEEVDQDELDRIYGEAYESEPFVRVVDSPPGLRDVRGTNGCHLMPIASDDRVVVLSAIDNLWKGASGQAVQNLNLMLGLDETAGLS